VITTSIILAGGLGTRLKKTIPNLPKPMAPVNGRPFLEYQIDFLIHQGITKIIISVGYLSQIIIDHFGNKYKNVSIEYSKENTPLGTGGGLMIALKNLKNPVLVINGDTFFKVDLIEFEKFHSFNNSKLTVSLFRSNPKNRYMGIDIDCKGEIISLASDSDLINGGVYIIEPSIFNSFNYQLGDKFSFEDDILFELVNNPLKLFGKEFEGIFIDIGIPEDYYRAHELLIN
jgi:D-glycero-alpha-D-manno-heptose 1-phosphate guanylyltransferase